MSDKFEWSLVIAGSGMIDAKYVPCDSCKRARANDICDAFPDGIPEDILTGKNNHTKPYPGDHGIQFEAVEEPK